MKKALFAAALLTHFLLQAGIVLAQAAPEAPHQPPFTEVLGKMLPMFIIVFFIFYFMVIKPQTNKLRRQQTLLESLKKGDWVVTSSGIVARVAGLEEDCVLLDVSNNVKLKVEKEHIAKRKEIKTQEKASAA